MHFSGSREFDLAACVGIAHLWQSGVSGVNLVTYRKKAFDLLVVAHLHLKLFGSKCSDRINLH